MDNKPPYIFYSSLILVCLLAFSGGLVYRFYSLNRAGLLISLALSAISFIIIQYFYLISNKKTRRPKQEKREKNNFKLFNFLLLAAYLLLLFFCFYFLFAGRTDAAIISPWQTVSWRFFALDCLSVLALIANAVFNRKFALPLIMLHYFLSLSVAVIVYKLGYGYDSFIHQATENLIAQTGAVDPKPFYYLGQYALVAIAHKLTALPVVWLDRLLVPILAALFLPLALGRALNAWFDDKKLNLITIIALPVLTFPFLIVTTPQNLAYLFLLLAIILALACRNLYDFLVIILLALAAVVTQPLAGIPALLLVLALAVFYGENGKIKKYLYALLILAAVSLLPALFYFLHKNLPAAGSIGAVFPDQALFNFDPAGRENFISNFVYLYGFNLKIFFTLIALGGVFIAWKYRAHCRLYFVFLAASLSLMASYLLTARLPFNFLISYEQDDYPRRILLTAAFFFLPFIIILLYSLLEKAARQNLFLKISLAVFLSLLSAAALYLSYPRHDNYFNSRGLSVSASDIKAVNWINRDAEADYLVLANQQVSAAALSQFGFKKYFPAPAGQIFYYPIPTSSPLYQYYLKMVYEKPSAETMAEAMKLTGAKTGYFVLNKYWWAFKKILDQAKLAAVSWREFDDGQIFVFKYER